MGRGMAAVVRRPPVGHVVGMVVVVVVVRGRVVPALVGRRGPVVPAAAAVVVVVLVVGRRGRGKMRVSVMGVTWLFLGKKHLLNREYNPQRGYHTGYLPSS